MSTKPTSTTGNLADSLSLALCINPEMNPGPPPTVSGPVTFEQIWLIEHFSIYLNPESPIKWLCSLPFAIGPHYPRFRFLMCPNGVDSSPQFRGQVGLFLYCEQRYNGLALYYHLGIVDKDGEHKNVRERHATFQWKQRTGFYKFISRDVLMDPEKNLLPDDQIKIYVKIFATFFEAPLDRKYYDYNQHYNGEGLNLENALVEGDYYHSDVIFAVDSLPFAAHKSIVMRSPGLAKLLEDSTNREAQEGKVIVDDVDVDTFIVILWYLYQMVIPDEAQLNKRLLAASNKYQMDPLKLACEENLTTKLTVDNAISLLFFSQLHNADLLKENCCEYIINNATKVMQSDCWMLLAKFDPKLCKEMGRRMVLMEEVEVKLAKAEKAVVETTKWQKSKGKGKGKGKGKRGKNKRNKKKKS